MWVVAQDNENWYTGYLVGSAVPLWLPVPPRELAGMEDGPAESPKAASDAAAPE